MAAWNTNDLKDVLTNVAGSERKICGPLELSCHMRACEGRRLQEVLCDPRLLMCTAPSKLLAERKCLFVQSNLMWKEPTD
jgi:hypothetical protein